MAISDYKGHTDTQTTLRTTSVAIGRIMHAGDQA